MFAITLNIDPEKLKDVDKKDKKPKKETKARKGQRERKPKDKDSEA